MHTHTHCLPRKTWERAASWFPRVLCMAGGTGNQQRKDKQIVRHACKSKAPTLILHMQSDGLIRVNIFQMKLSSIWGTISSRHLSANTVFGFFYWSSNKLYLWDKREAWRFRQIYMACVPNVIFFCTRRMKYTLNASYSTMVQNKALCLLVNGLLAKPACMCVCVLWKVLTINTVYFPEPLKEVKTGQRDTVKQRKDFQKGIFRAATSPFFPLHGMSISYWLAYKCNISRRIWVCPIISGGHFLWTGFIKEKGDVDVSGWIYQPQGRRFLQQVWCTKKKKKEKKELSPTALKHTLIWFATSVNWRMMALTKLKPDNI